MGRERGENGIIQLPNGAWQVRITFTDSKGSRRAIKRQAPTVSEAKQLRKIFLAELDNIGERGISGDRMTFEKLARFYVERKLFPAQYVNDRKVAGVRSLEPALANLRVLEAHFNRERIKQITTSEIEVFKSVRLETPTKNDVLRARRTAKSVVCSRSIASVNRELELLRAIMNFAKREGWIFRSRLSWAQKLFQKPMRRGANAFFPTKRKPDSLLR